MRLAKTVWAVSLTGALVVLAGCSGGDESPADPTSTPSPSEAGSTPAPAPTASPTRAAGDSDTTIPPARPAGLAGPPSEQAAGEAATYFHELAPYAFATGDLQAWNAMSSESCSFCTAIAAQIEAEAAAGKHREGGQVQVLDVQSYHHKKQQYAALVTLREYESRVIASDGSVDGEVDYKQDVQLEMLLTWNGTGWVVDGVDVKYANKL